jgi:hypothetical protein
VLNASSGDDLFLTNAGKLEELRRLNRASGENHFLGGHDELVTNVHTICSKTVIAFAYAEPGDGCVGLHMKVRSSNGQVCGRVRASVVGCADVAGLRHNTKRVTIERLLVLRHTQTLQSWNEAFLVWWNNAVDGGVNGSIVAHTAAVVTRVWLESLNSLHGSNEVLPVPAFVAELLPCIVVGFRATIPCHQVEGRATSQNFATVDVKFTTSSIGLCDCGEVPVVRSTKSAALAAGNVDLLFVPGCRTSFDYQDTLIRQLDTEARCYSQTSGASTYDNLGKLERRTLDVSGIS